MWTLPPSHASELCLFPDSEVQHVHFAVESFKFLFVSSSWLLPLVPKSSSQHPLLFDAPSLKWQLGVRKVWSKCSGSGKHPFSKTSHSVLGPDSELQELADSWLLPVTSC